MRVDRRVDADRAKWEEQKTAQRQGMIGQLRQQRVQAFIQQLKTNAKISDRRKEIQQQAARQT
jgi:hypothetical protein